MTIKTLPLPGALISAASLAANPVAAHPGDHAGLDVNGFIAHFAQEPFHAGALLLAVVIAGFAILRRRKAKARRRGR
jgi:hypothetical protein